ncbi:MAG: M23 family metallopeptidase [Anaerolineales bacterium]|nr:M23 family metallopeptidase [Anaerolineales bacterium]
MLSMNGSILSNSGVEHLDVRQSFSKLNDSKIMMKQFLLLSLVMLTACTSSQPATQVIESISTPTPEPTHPPTITLRPITATPQPTATSTPTPIPCDPLTADFCITDGHFLFQRPIHPPDNDSVERSYPFASTANATRDPHRGVEFVNELGTPVYAAGEGDVIFAGPDDVAIYSPWTIFYGNLVAIRHEDGLFTLYAHLSKIKVEAGEKVEAGKQIGEAGRSGVAIGSHLHFEVRRGDAEDYFSMVNPELWLIPSKPDFGALSISIQDANSTFQTEKVTLQQYSASGEVLGLNYLETYYPPLALGEENVGIGDLPAGRYRITFIHNGIFYERWVEVQSGKLTQVVIAVK